MTSSTDARDAPSEGRSTATRRPEVVVELNPRRTRVGEAAVAGLVSGLLFALVVGLQLADVAAVGSVIPLGLEFRSVAWVVHLGYSAMFGALFGLLVDSRPLWRYGRGFLGPAVGTAFGALVWSVHIALVWPLWAISIGVPTPPMVPFLNEVSLLSYLLFGAILGAVINVVH